MLKLPRSNLRRSIQNYFYFIRHFITMAGLYEYFTSTNKSYST